MRLSSKDTVISSHLLCIVLSTKCQLGSGAVPAIQVPIYMYTVRYAWLWTCACNTGTNIYVATPADF